MDVKMPYEREKLWRNKKRAQSSLNEVKRVN